MAERRARIDESEQLADYFSDVHAPLKSWWTNTAWT